MKMYFEIDIYFLPPLGNMLIGIDTFFPFILLLHT